jgi:hypothetical protein
MTALDLALWEALERIEPSGPERGDMQAGIVAQAVAAYGFRRAATLPALSEYVIRFKPGTEAMEARRKRARAALNQAVRNWGK